MRYLEELGHVFVFASNADADTDPDCYRNLVVNSGVTAEIGADTFAATAEPIVGTERDRIYAVQADLNPGFGEYQMKTTQVTPMVELIRDEVGSDESVNLLGATCSEPLNCERQSDGGPQYDELAVTDCAGVEVAGGF